MDISSLIADTIKTVQDLIDDNTEALVAAQQQAVTDKQSIADLSSQLTAVQTQLASVQAQLAAAIKKRIIGFNGHTFSAPEYSNIDNTIAALTSFGANTYRVDVVVSNSGVPNNVTKLTELVTKCTAAGIKVMPMINVDYGDVNGGYTAGLAIGKGLASLQFETLEIGNEMAIKDWAGDGSVRCLKSGNGDIAVNYDLVLLAKVGQCVKGIVDGIRQAGGKQKLIINGEWLHTYFIDYLLNTLGIKFDILAWHWYSGQQIARAGQPSIKSVLNGLFPGMPIIWNEVGLDTNATTGLIDATHVIAFNQFVGTDIKGDDIVFYELFDQASRLPSKKEAGYGFYDLTGKPKEIVSKITQ